jgi:hypothetical protein
MNSRSAHNDAPDVFSVFAERLRHRTMASLTRQAIVAGSLGIAVVALFPRWWPLASALGALSLSAAGVCMRRGGESTLRFALHSGLSSSIDVRFRHEDCHRAGTSPRHAAVVGPPSAMPTRGRRVHADCHSGAPCVHLRTPLSGHRRTFGASRFRCTCASFSASPHARRSRFRRAGAVS